ncbi:hypothetical protein LINPERPRIM_LOCUS9686, partial [Linum perenne]
EFQRKKTGRKGVRVWEQERCKGVRLNVYSYTVRDTEVVLK